MIKATSLKRRIIAQFLVLLLPMLAVLAFQTISELQRNAGVQRAVEAHQFAASLRDAYRRFADGAADAIDLGTLARPRVDALLEAAGHAKELAKLDAGQLTLADFGAALSRLHSSLTADPGVDNLNRWREAIVQARQRVDEVYAYNEKALDRLITDSLVQAARSRHLVIAAVLLVLGALIWFVRQMIRGLTEPLEVAVRVANRITEGERVAAADFRCAADIDNLLASLQRMNDSLDRYRDEAARQRRGLEEKIEQLATSQRSLAEAQQLAHLGNWNWEPELSAAHWSDQMHRLVGGALSAAQPTWRRFLRAVPPAERDELRARFVELRAAPRAFSIEHRIVDVRGEERIVVHQGYSEADASGRVVRLIGSVQDITERKHALHDPLTRLPNRRFFTEHLRKAVERAKRNNAIAAVMFIDLDRFKRINDTLGHDVGDELLCEAAERIVHCVRGRDTVARNSDWAPGLDPAASAERRMVARLGGDEFTVLLSDLNDGADAGRVARRVTSRLAEAFVIRGNELFVTASVGIAVFPQDGDNVDQLLSHADAAMYEAKRKGKNTFQFFTRELHAAGFDKLMVEKELRHAIEREQFVLHYQPKVDAASGAIVGVEALIRWGHPDWGLLPPARFVPLAEELGLIVPVGDWVLESACRQASEWRRAAQADVPVAINLASPSLRKPKLVRDVASALRRHGLPASCLVIEVTESLLMQEFEGTQRTLRGLRELGVRLAIDDFGTGYSSLSHLQHLPVDQLKIDRSFVSHVVDSSNHAAIVRAVVTLGRSIGLETIAEGVETAAQAGALIGLRCPMMQGYLFSVPLPADAMASLLRSPAPFRRQLSELQAHLRAPIETLS